MGRTFVWAVLGAFGVSLTAAACSDGNVVRGDPYEGGEGGHDSSTGGKSNSNAGAPDAVSMGGDGAVVPSGKGVGEACSDRDKCRDGLACNSKSECEPAGDKGPGDACVISAECEDGQCFGRQCIPAGMGQAGEACSTDGDCDAGLRCAIVGLGLACAPEGSADVGGSCVTGSDCFGGLACLAEHCAVPPVGMLPAFGKPWAGAECAAPVDEDVKAYFEVPGAEGADELDFFRLPFPNDVRRDGDKLDLTGFPTPGAGLLGVDAVKLYVDAISQHDKAWGAYPSLIFRFSGAVDFDTFGDNATQFIDITDPAAPQGVAWRRFSTDARSAYVCQHFVAVQPRLGRALDPGHVYAVLTLSEADGKQLKGRKDGKPVVASANMKSVLGDVVPTDAKLKAAHAAFAPLRAYFKAKKEPTSNVLSASVFTVGEVRSQMETLAKAVEKAAAPSVVGDWVKCDGKAKSPCDQAELERACGDDPQGYDEYQAVIKLPVYQQGTAPYLTPVDGGGIDTAKPHDEPVCLSLTVPEGVPPSAGWPTVVFAHGTGGNYRNHVRQEVAGNLSAGATKFAVLGIDQVEHGSRRGKSTESPDNLFFNFLNPEVTRGNPLQGAADQLSLARFAKTLDIDATVSRGSAIKLDKDKLFFFGHSQGSTEGSLMLPFSLDYKAALLSGNGASLRDALLTKTKPQNIAGALPTILQDPYLNDPNVGKAIALTHPVLSLLQQWIDPADPLNFAGPIAKPAKGYEKHVLQTFGLDDSFSPPVTLETYALAAQLTQVTPDASAVPLFVDKGLFSDPKSIVPVPFKADAGDFTRGVRQYGPAKGSDGHFVVFDNPVANADMVLFFSGAAGTTPPTIGSK